MRDEVLLKPCKLTEEEMETIRSHPLFGDAILAPLKFLKRVTGMVKHHHERWDGKGYPDGLRRQGHSNDYFSLSSSTTGHRAGGPSHPFPVHENRSADAKQHTIHILSLGISTLLGFPRAAGW